MSEDLASTPPPDEAPPILGRWRNLYLVVLGELAILVLLFALLTRWAS